jgi:hypothetical protein
MVEIKLVIYIVPSELQVKFHTQIRQVNINVLYNLALYRITNNFHAILIENTSRGFCTE